MKLFEREKEIFLAHKICVIVPTYNNSATLGAVLDGILKYTDQIIVVNDGSTDNTSNILQHFHQLEIVDYSTNVGKGYALRTGFKRALELGYNIAITIDSDGQHFPDDIPRFLDVLIKSPDALIIGDRNMEQPGIPGKSSFGNRFSNFWFWVETGLKLPDTQSGFRSYPIYKMKGISFFTRRFEFEIEAIVRCAWHGITVTTVPIQIHYYDKSTRVSHFRPFTDFTRISILNTFLVFIALLYIKPRDLIRGIKKKTLNRLFKIFCLVRMRQIVLKLFRWDLVFLWASSQSGGSK